MTGRSSRWHCGATTETTWIDIAGGRLAGVGSQRPAADQADWHFRSAGRFRKIELTGGPGGGV